LISCIEDNRKIRPLAVDNVALSFSIQGVPNAELGQRIDNIQVFLFDENKNYVDSRLLSDPTGESFALTPGLYYMMCWANAGDNSAISAMDEYSTLENSFIEIVSTRSGDPIYYAPYKEPEMTTRSTRVDPSDPLFDYALEVASSTETTIKNMVFFKAHRTVAVYVRGYEYAPQYDGRPVVVTQTNAGNRFDFMLQADPTDLVTLRQTSVPEVKEGYNVLSTTFYSANIPLTGTETVNVYHPVSNELLTSINLASFVTENSISDDSVIEVDVSFENTVDTGVTISIPPWNDNEIVQEF
jgi:hypothetical protein